MEKYWWDSENKFNSKEFFEEVWRRMIEFILLRSKTPLWWNPSSPLSYQHTMKPKFYQRCYYPQQYCECKKCLERKKQEIEEEFKRKQEEEKQIEQNSSNYMQIEEERERRRKEMARKRSYQKSENWHTMKR